MTLAQMNLPNSNKGSFRHVWRSSLLSLLVVSWMTAPAQAVPAVDPNTGHVYIVVSQALAWPEAKEAAEQFVFNNLACHLAVITSSSENSFVVNNVVGGFGDIWVGGQRRTACPNASEDDSESFWGKWVTGEFWGYTNWAADAPDACNDSCLMYTTEEEEPEALEGGAAQGPVAQWDEENCEEELPYIIECEPGIGAPALSAGSLVALGMLMTASTWWLLRRRQARLSA